MSVDPVLPLTANDAEDCRAPLSIRIFPNTSAGYGDIDNDSIELNMEGLDTVSGVIVKMRSLQ